MKGIKFNQPSITAILEGRKTMTRRPIKDTNENWYINKTILIFDNVLQNLWRVVNVGHGVMFDQTIYSKYKIGETVFVQEEFICDYAIGGQDENGDAINCIYRADSEDKGTYETWSKPSEMHENQARIFLKITNIKVERLQDISEDDCRYEGVMIGKCVTKNFPFIKEDYVSCFQKQIWNKLPYQAPCDWNSDPYVFVYEFEIVK